MPAEAGIQKSTTLRRQTSETGSYIGGSGQPPSFNDGCPFTSGLASAPTNSSALSCSNATRALGGRWLLFAFLLDGLTGSSAMNSA